MWLFVTDKNGTEILKMLHSHSSQFLYNVEWVCKILMVTKDQVICYFNFKLACLAHFCVNIVVLIEYMYLCFRNLFTAMSQPFWLTLYADSDTLAGTTLHWLLPFHHEYFTKYMHLTFWGFYDNRYCLLMVSFILLI